ncbi:MAG TPA: hypothetical protein VG815_16695 [Chloroflexota bacterium]|nr:hypothetical protein [Chloroflexota bacterium]
MGQEAVFRLAAEDPQWIPAVRAALFLADSGTGVFAGSWILAELRRRQAPRTWYPNFRRLVTFGILESAGNSTRQGQRAYYRIINIEGVRTALAELDHSDRADLLSSKPLSFTGIGRSGTTDLGERSPDLLGADFPTE